MIIEDTRINGVEVIHSRPFRDDRGFLNRIFCQEELAIIRSNIIIAQANHSMTALKGTVRGMHFQHPPHAEMKIVRCVKGSIFDVAVDLRKHSPTFLQWHGEILSSDNMKALVVPEGCAHGFQSLEDGIEMIYLHTKAYCKEAEETLRYDDPKVAIQWPLPVLHISVKDVSSPLITNN
ncbi:MAG: dTDP-4-dehydrorhamnose 3,5-epimerase [Prevotellaceae bacterium]|jgi:dTDP-4-dehydrorhamnose 3,5-epimerase|nr:dTDP-4-dehydrorhamnose 3,5-epimerase [Prevotellaceae bacterium]